MTTLDFRLDSYLDRFESQDRVGLLILDEESQLKDITSKLTENDLHEVRTWWSALTRLASRENAFMVLDTELSMELFDLVDQYRCQRGEIQIVDQKTKEVQKLVVDTDSSRLLLVTTANHLESIEKIFPLTCRVGISERI